MPSPTADSSSRHAGAADLEPGDAWQHGASLFQADSAASHPPRSSHAAPPAMHLGNSQRPEASQSPGSPGSGQHQPGQVSGQAATQHQEAAWQEPVIVQMSVHGHAAAPAALPARRVSMSASSSLSSSLTDVGSVLEGIPPSLPPPDAQQCTALLDKALDSAVSTEDAVSSTSRGTLEGVPHSLSWQPEQAGAGQQQHKAASQEEAGSTAHPPHPAVLTAAGLALAHTSRQQEPASSSSRTHLLGPGSRSLPAEQEQALPSEGGEPGGLEPGDLLLSPGNSLGEGLGAAEGLQAPPGVPAGNAAWPAQPEASREGDQELEGLMRLLAVQLEGGHGEPCPGVRIWGFWSLGSELELSCDRCSMVSESQEPLCSDSCACCRELALVVSKDRGVSFAVWVRSLLQECGHAQWSVPGLCQMPSSKSTCCACSNTAQTSTKLTA